MIEQIINFLEDKKIIILGFGIEGKSTYNFIRRYFPDMPLVEDTAKAILIKRENICRKIKS